MFFQTWLTDDEEYSESGSFTPESIKVSKRIQLATRMNAFINNGGEPFQVGVNLSICF